MKTESGILPDGCYPNRNATIHVKNGKVSVVIHDDFGLRPGTKMPLLRNEHNMEIDGREVISEFFNGHAII